MNDDQVEILNLLKSIDEKLDRVLGDDEQIASGPGEDRQALDRFEDDDVITVLADVNPKKSGSASFDRFELYRHVQTVRGYLLSGAGAHFARANLRNDLRWDTERKFIRIDKGVAPQSDKAP